MRGFPEKRPDPFRSLKNIPKDTLRGFRVQEFLGVQEFRRYGVVL
jgi:hypothetical protein